MEALIATAVFAACMAVMGIGVFLKGRPLRKDCGLDPATGERMGYCGCAATGKESCESSNDPGVDPIQTRTMSGPSPRHENEEEKVVALPRSR